MVVLTTRDALKRELQRHIGAHADIVANDLYASGAVIDAATLADDEALIADLNSRAGWTYGTRDALEALAAALTERA